MTSSKSLKHKVCRLSARRRRSSRLTRADGIDWSDADTSLAHIGNEAGGASGLNMSGEQSGGDHLWEDNWDDDDVEDDFGKALRCVDESVEALHRLTHASRRAELEKQAGQAQPMAT